MDGLTSGILLRVFLDDNDRAGNAPLYAAILQVLRLRGIDGATVFRGIQGFGNRDVIHRGMALAWTSNLPILIEVVDREEHIAAVLPELRAMIPDGLIVLEPVRFERILRTETAPGR
jgi:hypothetical protein